MTEPQPKPSERWTKENVELFHQALWAMLVRFRDTNGLTEDEMTEFLAVLKASVDEAVRKLRKVN